MGNNTRNTRNTRRNTLKSTEITRATSALVPERRPSGLTETKESDLGFRLVLSCANLVHALRNFNHSFRNRS